MSRPLRRFCNECVHYDIELYGQQTEERWARASNVKLIDQSKREVDRSDNWMLANWNVYVTCKVIGMTDFEGFSILCGYFKWSISPFLWIMLCINLLPCFMLRVWFKVPYPHTLRRVPWSPVKYLFTLHTKPYEHIKRTCVYISINAQPFASAWAARHLVYAKQTMYCWRNENTHTYTTYYVSFAQSMNQNQRACRWQTNAMSYFQCVRHLSLAHCESVWMHHLSACVCVLLRRQHCARLRDKSTDTLSFCAVIAVCTRSPNTMHCGCSTHVTSACAC